MSPSDQWFYLEGAETRGPVSSQQLVQMVRNGSLNPATQVAQAGWPQWSPMSAALGQRQPAMRQQPRQML